ncbi:MAG TPA: AAA family ATPase, partial [candidate division Zixibacteria bacterium]|nr:AAA family ATPase [candidate division Zixibacteria bacterium]
MTNLFEENKARRISGEYSFLLADRMRPRTLDEIVGQEHLIGEGKPIRRMVETDELKSMILWGPPGSGKTTIAYVIARLTKMDFLSFSAVLASIKEIKQVIERAERNLKLYGRRSILFIDEIHRFNKAQQDAFLPYVERGAIILIGATTENPSFEIISPLLSRLQVFVLNPLEPHHIKTIVLRALTDKERGLGKTREDIDDDALELIANVSSGDARFALNLIELAAQMSDRITVDVLKTILQRERIIYDKSGEEHYNLI